MHKMRDMFYLYCSSGNLKLTVVSEPEKEWSANGTARLQSCCGDSVRDDILYVGLSSKAPYRAEGKHFVLIYDVPVPEHFEKMNTVIKAESISEDALISTVSGFFTRYLDCLMKAEELRNAAKEERGLTSVIRQTGRMLDCSVLAGDISFSVLGHSDNMPERSTWEEYICEGYTPPFNVVLSHEAYYEAGLAAAKYVHHLPGLGKSLLMRDKVKRKQFFLVNLQEKDECIGHLTIAVSGRDFTMWDFELAAVVCELMISFLCPTAQYPVKDFMRKRYVTQLLKGETDKFMTYSGWQQILGTERDGVFSLMIVDWSEKKLLSCSVQSILDKCGKLIGNVSHSGFVSNGKSAAAVIYHKAAQKQQELELGDFEAYLSEMGFFGIHSERFRDLFDASVHYQRCRQLLQYSFCADEGEFLLTAKSIGFFAYVGSIREKMGEQFFELPDIEKLQNSDKDRYGEYLDTLYVYLRCSQKAELTCRNLFIHRNTLNYRLRKIKNVLKLDWSSGEEMMRIFMALTNREMEKRRSRRLR